MAELQIYTLQKKIWKKLSRIKTTILRNKNLSLICDIHLQFCANLINNFLFLRDVELGHVFHPKCLGVSGLCNSYSFHSLMFKLVVTAVAVVVIDAAFCSLLLL